MLRPRPATAADYPAFLRFWRELAIPQRVPDAGYFEATIAPFTIFLEDAGGGLAAYGLCYPYGPRGDVRQIVVDPAWRRRGVGRQLLDVLRTRLRAAGCRDWRLEVRADNAAAIALYEAVGMRWLHDIRIVRIPAAMAAGFAGPRSARWTASPVLPADDDALEARFGYGAGQIMRWRTARPDAGLWQLRDRGEPVAFTRYWRGYQPDCALCFPFRAGSAELAAHLLAAAVREISDLELEVVDPGVAEAILAAGAREQELHHAMGGPIDS